MTIEIIAASRRNEQAFAQMPLRRSLHCLRFDSRLVPRLKLNNAAGLGKVYNDAIEADSEHDILIFIHNDVWIEDYYFSDRLVAGLAQFDVIGVASNTRLPRITSVGTLINGQGNRIFPTSAGP